LITPQIELALAYKLKFNVQTCRSFDETMADNEMRMASWRKSGMKGAPTAYLRYADVSMSRTSSASWSASRIIVSLGI